MNQNKTASSAPNGTDQPPVLYEDPHKIMRSALKNRAIDNKGAALAELTDSVRIHGVIEPLIVRKSGTVSHPFELIAGERRWLASLHAKLTKVPIIVRTASDLEVLELRTVENDQREDLTALDRAEQYQQLVEEYVKAGDKRNKAIERLAQRVGKSRSTVYEILSLVELKAHEPIRKLLDAGRLPTSHAALLPKLKAAPEILERIAKVIAPDPEVFKDQQAERKLDAQQMRLGGGYEGERDEKGVMPFRQAKQMVDAQVEKLDARAKWLELADRHAKGGGLVLTTPEQLEGAIGEYGQAKGGYVKRSEKIMGYGGGYDGKTLESLIKKAQMPALTLAHDDDFKPVWLFKRKEAIAAIEASGHKKVKRSSSSSSHDSWQAEQNKRRELEAKMAPVEEAATVAIVKAAAQPKPKFPWLIFFSELLEGNHNLARRRGWKASQLAHKATALKESDRNALLIEHLITDGCGFDAYRKNWDPQFVSLAKYYGIDLAKMTKELAPDPEPVPKAKAKSKKPGAKAKHTGLSTAGRKKLGELMKARWAARRKDAGVRK